MLLRAAAAVLVGAASVGGCGSPPAPGLVVFAASSLTFAFTEIGTAFRAVKSDTDSPNTDSPESDSPETDSAVAFSTVEFTFAGSADLLAQLTGGAGADVFAAADTATMDKAARAGLIDGEPVFFAANTLTIVVAPGNPAKIAGIADLARPGLAVVACAPQVPCGAATAKLQDATGVRLAPVSEESAAGAVLTKVTSGQADAGIVYVTDARAAGDAVTEVPVPEAPGVVNTYSIAVLKQARDSGAARRFVEYVVGEAGQRILEAAGFASP